MPNRYNPGCSCCGGCPSATLDGTYTPSSPWNFAIYSTPGSPNRNGGQIASGTNGQTLRLVFGFVDDDNYAYVEATVESSEGANDGQFILGVRIAGVDTVPPLVEPTIPPLIRASSFTAGTFYIFGSLSGGILVGGIAAELPTFPSGYIYTVGTDCGVADGQTGSSTGIGTATLYGPAPVDITGCQGSYTTCCNTVAPYPISANATPQSVTLNVSAGVGDPWTGAWVLPIYAADRSNYRFSCSWFLEDSGLTFTVNFAISGAFADLTCQVVQAAPILFALGRTNLGASQVPACVDWSGLSLPLVSGSTKSATFTVDAN